VVVKDKAKIQELAGGFNGWLKQAPVIIVACADPKDAGATTHELLPCGCGISMQELILAATDMELGHAG